MVIMMKESSSDTIFRCAITVFLCLIALIALIPLVTVVATSFSSRAAVDTNSVTLWPKGFTLASWAYILKYKALWKSFGITAASTLIGTFLALVVNSLMAYPLSKRDFKLGKVIMMGIVLTMIFKAPTVPYFLALRNMGLFNNPAVLVVPHIISAYNLTIMRTFFKQFPQEVEEAATIDGCGSFQLLFRIVLPSSTAVLATLGLFYAVTIWNQFQHPVMFIQDPELFPLQLKIRQLINSGSELQMVTTGTNVNYNDRTLRAATVIFAIIPIMAVYPYLQKYFAKGAMLGSVKG